MPTQTLEVYRKHHVHPSVHISCKHKDELILMKLNTVAVYNLRMCMKEDDLGPTNIKGDN